MKASHHTRAAISSLFEWLLFGLWAVALGLTFVDICHNGRSVMGARGRTYYPIVADDIITLAVCLVLAVGAIVTSRLVPHSWRRRTTPLLAYSGTLGLWSFFLIASVKGHFPPDPIRFPLFLVATLVPLFYFIAAKFLLEANNMASNADVSLDRGSALMIDSALALLWCFVFLLAVIVLAIPGVGPGRSSHEETTCQQQFLVFGTIASVTCSALAKWIIPRRWSYRWFYVLVLGISIAELPLPALRDKSSAEFGHLMGLIFGAPLSLLFARKYAREVVRCRSGAHDSPNGSV